MAYLKYAPVTGRSGSHRFTLAWIAEHASKLNCDVHTGAVFSSHHFRRSLSGTRDCKLWTRRIIRRSTAFLALREDSDLGAVP